MAAHEDRPHRKRGPAPTVPREADGRVIAEYWVWNGMRQRCSNPNHVEYQNYGARGIVVCDRWQRGEGGQSAFLCFLADMGRRPSKGYSIERRDVDGPYSPSNCFWATSHEQSRNTRRNIHIALGGDVRVVRDWATEVGLPYMTLKGRIRRGLAADQALHTPSGGFQRPSLSGFRGVYFHKGRKHPWQARIKVGLRFISLGYFASAKDAARAYNDAAIAHYGEGAVLNPLR